MKDISEFLAGKSEHTVRLFWAFIEACQELGKVTIRPTKTMIVIEGKTRAVYITRLGKDFIDVTFPFDQPYEDNLCFAKIARVPGQQQFNHHLRIMREEDINKEVKKFMKLSFG
jgi:hypothetical protein